MNPGELRHRVTIQQSQETVDADKTPSLSWVPVATVWAAVEPINGREYIQLKQTNATLTTCIRIRYRSGFTPAMRIVYGTRIFDINDVIDVNERHVEIHLMCTEVIPGGGRRTAV